MTNDMNSWQLAHFSPNVPSGNYLSMRHPSGANWRTRVIIPMQEGVVAVQVTENNQSYYYLPRWWD